MGIWAVRSNDGEVSELNPAPATRTVTTNGDWTGTYPGGVQQREVQNRYLVKATGSSESSYPNTCNTPGPRLHRCPTLIGKSTVRGNNFAGGERPAAAAPAPSRGAHDTDYTNIYSTAVDMKRDLDRWFNRLREPKLILMFLDACFSGRAGGRTFEGPRSKDRRSTFRSLDPICLRGLDFGEGRLIIAACDDNQVSHPQNLTHVLNIWNFVRQFDSV